MAPLRCIVSRLQQPDTFVAVAFIFHPAHQLQHIRRRAVSTGDLQAALGMLVKQAHPARPSRHPRDQSGGYRRQCHISDPVPEANPAVFPAGRLTAIVDERGC